MYPQTKFEILTSKNIGDMDQTRKRDGRTDGQTDGWTDSAITICIKITLALTVFKKLTFQKNSHLNLLGSKFDLDIK